MSLERGILHCRYVESPNICQSHIFYFMNSGVSSIWVALLLQLQSNICEFLVNSGLLLKMVL
jgi:hypothetical protein